MEKEKLAREMETPRILCDGSHSSLEQHPPVPLALGVPEEIKSVQPVLGCKVKVMKNKIIIALLGFQEFLWGGEDVCPLLTNKKLMQQEFF